MAYVRQHGNQIAIVSGDRDKETGSVQQRVLFTFYSKDEALAALGHSSDDRHHLFQNLMRQAYPSTTFDWERINKAIEQKLDTLPEHYEARTTECGAEFSRSIRSLARNLVLADPHLVPSAKKVLKSEENSLLAVRELIDHSLSLIRFYDKHDKESEFDSKDEFHWRYMLRGSEVPPALEEWAEGFYHKMDYPMAEAIFQLLVSVFDNYAEGHNYLGLIALEQRKHKKAVEHFERTVAVGRNLFPRKLPKNDYWLDHSTRPFMRGMMNLILALTADGDYQKALTACDQLEKECGDKSSANDYRATLHLNLGNWSEAIAYTSSEQDFVKAFAEFEIGNEQRALECFLLDAAESPHTARLLLHMKKPKPENSLAVDDHNSGVHLAAQLDGYFQRQSIQCKRFFEALAKQLSLIEMFEKLDQHTQNHFDGPREKHSDNFKEWHAMREKPYVRQQSKELMTAINKSSLKLVK